MGIVRGVVAVVTAVVIGPIPTLVHLLFLPFIRLFVFARGVWSEHFRPDADAQDGSPGGSGEQPAAAEAPQLTAAMREAASATQELPKGIRQRKKKESEEEKKQRNEALLAGAAAPEAQAPEKIPTEAINPGG